MWVDQTLSILLIIYICRRYKFVAIALFLYFVYIHYDILGFVKTFKLFMEYALFFVFLFVTVLAYRRTFRAFNVYVRKQPDKFNIKKKQMLSVLSVLQTALSVYLFV